MLLGKSLESVVHSSSDLWVSFLVFIMFLKVWVFVNKTSYNVKKKTFNVKYTDVKQTVLFLWKWHFCGLSISLLLMRGYKGSFFTFWVICLESKDIEFYQNNFLCFMLTSSCPWLFKRTKASHFQKLRFYYNSVTS